MYPREYLVKHKREGRPNGFEKVTDTYEFDPTWKNGQVEKVVTVHHPGQCYRTILHIHGKQPMEREYPEGQWGLAQSDLEVALQQNQCDLFTIRDLRRPPNAL